MTVNLARYKPSGEYVTVRRINLEACTNEMVTFLQVMLQSLEWGTASFMYIERTRLLGSQLQVI